jgi:hypothetical protein
MNTAHFHLLSVHLPIVAMPILALLLITGMWLKKPDLSKVALFGIVIISLFTIPIFLSGEGAEEVVEHLPSISENQIEFHEKAATIAFIMVSLLAQRFHLSCLRYLVLSALLLTVISSGTLIWVANEGGKIRHTEITFK